jgi:hypothetical protein
MALWASRMYFLLLLAALMTTAPTVEMLRAALTTAVMID